MYAQKVNIAQVGNKCLHNSYHSNQYMIAIRSHVHENEISQGNEINAYVRAFFFEPLLSVSLIEGTEIFVGCLGMISSNGFHNT